MSKATFVAAASRCALRSTTYLYRRGVLLDEPLIDFGKEPDPPKAHACFSAALESLDREATQRGVTRIGRVWESRT